MNGTTPEPDPDRLTELRTHVARLQDLLNDPQPGLGMWVKFYGERMQAISDFWNLSGNATHSGQRLALRGKCEKCGCPTNWVINDKGRPAYWCGCVLGE